MAMAILIFFTQVVDLKMYFLEIVDIYTILRMTALTFNKISGDYIGRPFRKII